MPECVYRYYICTGASGSLKREGIDAPEMELKLVMNCHVHAKIQTLVLYKSSKHSHLMTHLSSPQKLLRGTLRGQLSFALESNMSCDGCLNFMNTKATL